MNKHLLSPDVPVRLQDKFGQSLASGSYIYAYVLFTGLAMFFFTDVFKIPAKAVGIMMMVATIWDGINDPIIGLIIDKTHTRYGKVRPYILFGGIAVAITTVLTFSVPHITSEVGRTAYAYVTYILMGMSLTVMNMAVPILMTRFTKDSRKIPGLNAWTYAGTTIISVFGALSLMKLLGIFAGPEGDMEQAFQRLAMLASAICLVGSIAAAFLVKERDFDNMAEAGQYKSHPVGEYIKAVAKNKYYLILIAGVVIFMACYTLAASTHMYYVTYNLGNPDAYSILSALDYAGPVVAIFTISFLVKRFDKKKIVIFALLLVVFGTSMRLITGDKNTTVMVVFAAITYVGVGFFSLNATPMLIDTAKYGQMKTGVDASGLVISSFTLAQKIGAGLATGLLGILLDKAGYVESAAQQPEAALSIIKNANITSFAIAAAVSAIIIGLFYKLTNKKMAEFGLQEDAVSE